MSQEITKGPQDPTPMSISDHVIVDLRTQVGSIEDSNIRKGELAAEKARVVAEHE